MPGSLSRCLWFKHVDQLERLDQLGDFFPSSLFSLFLSLCTDIIDTPQVSNSLRKTRRETRARYRIIPSVSLSLSLSRGHVYTCS